MSCSTNQEGLIDNAVPVLLVDGYNVCGYWVKLKKHFMNGRLHIARQKLIDELITFSMLRGFYSFFIIQCCLFSFLSLSSSHLFIISSIVQRLKWLLYLMP